MDDQTGWKCPACNKGNAPTAQFCWHCAQFGGKPAQPFPFVSDPNKCGFCGGNHGNMPCPRFAPQCNSETNHG